MKLGLHGKYSGLEPLMQVPKVVLEYEGSWDERSPAKNRNFQALFKHYRRAQYLKITQNVVFEFFNFGISINFCPTKSDLSGNTV